MINYGIQFIEQLADQWKFNNADDKPVVENGQWDSYLPDEEGQTVGMVDTNNCTTLGTLNAIEMIMAYNGIRVNYSDRYTAIMAGTTKKGNDPHRVAEAIRRSGLIEEHLLPKTGADTVDSYYMPNPMDTNLVLKGWEWLKKWDFAHYWVFSKGDTVQTKISQINYALKYSPVCVSVFAWLKNKDIYIKPERGIDNHWCVIYGTDENGNWKVFDSLDRTKKILDKHYNFDCGKMFTIQKRRQSLFNKIISTLCSIFR